MKVALVHDWLTTAAGAEKVLQSIYELYPGDIYTLVFNEKTLKELNFDKSKVFNSFIQKLPLAKKFYRYYLPLFPLAVEQFDLRDYDLVISSSHAVAKGVITSSEQLHICYCHTPIRYAWDLYHEYVESLKGVRGLLARLFLHYIRIWDFSTLNRADYLIANSKFVAKRIRKIYGREATVIYPPVEVDKFEPETEKEDFYVTASRLVPYKKVDVIVEAFKYLPNKKLIVLGDGPEFKKLKELAPPNVELLGYQPFEKLKEYLKKARAFIFAAVEDFGILPVEAQACGTPVIAYGKGGVKETVIDGKTGLFFSDRNPEAIAKTVEKFEKIREQFYPEFIRKHAEKFSKKRFQKEFGEFVERKKEEFFT